MTPFECFKLIQSKERYLTEEELKDYSQWMINNILSCDPTLVFLSSELNKPMTNRMHYDCLYYGLPKSQKFIPYNARKPSAIKEIEYLKEYFQVSEPVAKMYQTLISKEEMDSIRNKFETMGRQTKTKKGES